jgi:hypothetical protein
MDSMAVNETHPWTSLEELETLLLTNITEVWVKFRVSSDAKFCIPNSSRFRQLAFSLVTCSISLMVTWQLSIERHNQSSSSAPVEPTFVSPHVGPSIAGTAGRHSSCI